MKHCVMCGELTDVDFLERCEVCFRGYVMNVKDLQIGLNRPSGYEKVTAAHYDDMRRRRVGSDGAVYRDYGRKHFFVGGKNG